MPKMAAIRRKLLLTLVAASLMMYVFMAASSLNVAFNRFERPVHLHDSNSSSGIGSETQVVAVEPSDGLVLSAANITTYLDQILSRNHTQLPSLQCPAFRAQRYKILKTASHGNTFKEEKGIRYFFAIDLRQSLSILPSLLSSVIQAAQLLGLDRCALSIVEGNSDDGTGDVLTALKPELEKLGLAYRLQFSSVDPRKSERIKRLAKLRNLALRPLVEGDVQADEKNDSTVIFLNDVVLCPDDILELLLQKRKLRADMTCAMDWTYVGRDPTFYDVWIARGLNGDSFFYIPPDGNWNSAWNLFWNADATRDRFHSRRPFQVFSCWNGATAFSARPFFPSSPPHKRIAFRAPYTQGGECEQGEPQLFCKDMWHRGYGKIAVVPAVNLEYSVENASRIKETKGFTAEIVGDEYEEADRFAWQLEPPEKVKCIPSYENQFWQHW